MITEIQKLKHSIKINNVILFIFLGMVLNLSVMVFNDSRMPAYFSSEETVPELHYPYIAFTDFKDRKSVV